MSSSRRRLNRSLFSLAPGRQAEVLLALLVAEEIELLIDTRRSAGDRAELERGCAQERIYFASRPQLQRWAAQPDGEPDAALAWAARMALRHRTCLLGEPTLAGEVADLVGLRLIDLDRQPARIAEPPA